MTSRWDRRFEERLRPRTQPGYLALPAFAAVGAGGFGAVALASVPALVPFAAALAVLAVVTGLPALVGRVETVVEEGTLHVAVSPTVLAETAHVRVPVDRIATVRVVEAPLSDPPRDDKGATLDGFGGARAVSWPAGRGRLPDAPGVLLELDDGSPPRFPAVLPGRGPVGVVSGGLGPPGFVPTDHPEALAEAIESEREAKDTEERRRETREEPDPAG